MSPTDPKTKTFDELVETLSGHFEPKPIVIAERYHCHKRDQAAGESVSQFIAELRRLARHCEFKTFLDEALRDRFVCGLHAKATQNRLLTEKNLTLTKALEIAVGMEAAAKEVTELQARSHAAAGATSAAADKDVLQVTTTNSYQKNCYRCGKSGHMAAQCPIKGFRCHNCGKVGHLKRVCRQPKKPFRRQPAVQPRTTHHVKTVIEASEESEGEDMYYLNHVTAKPKPAIKVDLFLEGKPVHMELDTGAPVSLMTWTTFNSLFPGYSLQPCNLPMQTYLGEPIRVRGQARVEVQYEQQCEKLPLVIVDGNGPSLFGRQWLDSIKLNWKSINPNWKSINHVQSKTLQSVLDRHQEVFKQELGTLKGYEAKISVDPDARPRFVKPGQSLMP